jgi:lipopolysaccharide transport system ATP-binding protein
VISVNDLSKCYRIYEKPSDRIKQSLFGRWKTYFTEFWPLRNITFQLGPGDVVGVIGPNGSGKSTLLQLITGILEPTEGTVVTEGKIAALLELGAGFNPEFTGHENLMINAAILGLSKEAIEEKYDAIVEFADIGEFLHQPVKTYSSGMYVRLAFSISAHVDADILIIDEALAVGDAGFQFKCLARIDELIKRGTTVLLVSHDQQVVKTYCTSAIYLNKGRVMFHGKTEMALEQYLQDVMEVQRNQLGKVEVKESRSGDAYVFGSEHGSIESVEMIVNGLHQDYCRHGDRVVFRIKANVRESVSEPRLMLVVRDSNGYNLFSYDNLHAEQPIARGETGDIEAEIGFDCLLRDGEFSATVRLDQHHGNLQFSLVEKQVNAYNFSVIYEKRSFGAMVDLHGSFGQKVTSN